MISSVTFEKSTWNTLPHKFEAGTPDISGAIALGVAIDYIQSIGFPWIAAHEQDLLEYGTAALSSVEGLRLIGTARRKASILSFVLDGVHPHDIGTIVDREGIAIRTGHHCAQPVMDRFGVPATARASLAMYNTRDEIDALVRCAGASAGRYLRSGWLLAASSWHWKQSGSYRTQQRAASSEQRHNVRSDRPLPGSHPRPQSAAEKLPRARRRDAPGARATIRSAAIVSALPDASTAASSPRWASRDRAARSRRRRRR